MLTGLFANKAIIEVASTRDILLDSRLVALLEEKIRTTQVIGSGNTHTVLSTLNCSRSVGEVTDIVAKEMYTFTDRETGS